MPPKAVPKTATGVSDGKQPTAQEAYLFYTIIKNMKGKPEIDWAAVAADTGYKTAETAKVTLAFLLAFFQGSNTNLTSSI